MAGSGKPVGGGAGAAGQTIGEAVTSLARALRAEGLESAEQDARLLVVAAAGVSREVLLRAPETALTPTAARTLAEFAARRCAQEPVSRILGVRGFYGREFRVSRATLDPRPETETVVDAALEVAAGEAWLARPLRIVDVGTGTGCLLLTLLAELPEATGVGTDISPDALHVAAGNAARLRLERRVSFERRRSLEPQRGERADTFDLLVSNPPYIPTGDIAALEAGVRNFDPHLALDGGSDGLEIYRQIAARLIEAVPDGWSLLEVGAGQSEDVANLIRKAVPTHRVREMRSWLDLAGHTRCVAVRTQM